MNEIGASVGVMLETVLQEISGGVVSITVTICGTLAVLPSSSVAVRIRGTRPVEACIHATLCCIGTVGITDGRYVDKRAAVDLGMVRPFPATVKVKGELSSNASIWFEVTASPASGPQAIV